VAEYTDDIKLSRRQRPGIVESTSSARLTETRSLPTAAAGHPMPIELQHGQRYVQGFSALLFGTGRHAPSFDPFFSLSTDKHLPHSRNVILLERDTPTPGIVTKISYLSLSTPISASLGRESDLLDHHPFVINFRQINAHHAYGKAIRDYGRRQE
jgi:hypothetical protein